MKILISDPLAQEAVDMLKNAGLDVDIKTGLPKEELVKIIGGYDAIIVRSATKVTREVIEAGSNLKVIARGGIGLDNIDVQAAKEKNIKVLNTPGASARSVAELAFSHMLTVARQVAYSTQSMKSGKWEKKRLKGVELYKKTLGIIGLGNIGKHVAKIADGFEMKVLVYDPYINAEAAKQAGAELVTLEKLLASADYITLHLPATRETKNLLGSAEFGKMKTGVILVNCARGGIVNEDALVEALKSGKVRGAGVDVYENEPPDAGYSLFQLENVALTPHIGASTIEGQFRVGLEIAEKVIHEFK